MFDLYVYDNADDVLVGVDPGYTESDYPIAAKRWQNMGFNVRVTDTRDGEVVQVLK